MGAAGERGKNSREVHEEGGKEGIDGGLVVKGSLVTGRLPHIQTPYIQAFLCIFSVSLPPCFIHLKIGDCVLLLLLLLFSSLFSPPLCSHRQNLSAAASVAPPPPSPSAPLPIYLNLMFSLSSPSLHLYSNRCWFDKVSLQISLSLYNVHAPTVATGFLIQPLEITLPLHHSDSTRTDDKLQLWWTYPSVI